MRTKISPTVILNEEATGLSARALAEFAAKASRAAGLPGAVTVLVTSSREMKKLNQRFRGKAHATDVLSFPPPNFVEGFAGDIAVSRDIAAKNARALGHSLGDEVRVLVLHGILHLAGYDHENDNGQMAQKEARLRRLLSLPTALTERASFRNARSVRSVRLRT